MIFKSCREYQGHRLVTLSLLLSLSQYFPVAEEDATRPDHNLLLFLSFWHLFVSSHISMYTGTNISRTEFSNHSSS